METRDSLCASGQEPDVCRPERNWKDDGGYGSSESAEAPVSLHEPRIDAGPAHHARRNQRVRRRNDVFQARSVRERDSERKFDDPKQRYLQVDEASEQEKVSVADGVCFMSTANIGTQYTSTRKMDRALEERFTTIEMDILERDEEFDLLQTLYPSVPDEKLDTLARIADETRMEVRQAQPQLNRIISTRQTVQMAEQIRDGYSMMEAIHVTVYPNYDNEGGDQSPRSTVQKIVQKEVDEQDVDSILFDRDDMRFSREMSGS